VIRFARFTIRRSLQPRIIFTARFNHSRSGVFA
jgi:hypothetical protein